MWRQGRVTGPRYDFRFYSPLQVDSIVLHVFIIFLIIHNFSECTYCVICTKKKKQHFHTENRWKPTFVFALWKLEIPDVSPEKNVRLLCQEMSGEPGDFRCICFFV